MKHEVIKPDFGNANGDFGGRDTPRATVTLICEVRQGTRPWQLATLDDISQTGFRIVWLPRARADLPLRIRIPGLALLSANIKWQQGNSVGCAFSEPLYIAVFEHIVRQASGDLPQV